MTNAKLKLGHSSFIQDGIAASRNQVTQGDSVREQRTVVVATGLNNPPAVSLYSRLGFVEYGRETKSHEAIEIVRLRKSAA